MNSLKEQNLEQRLRSCGLNATDLILDDQSALQILSVVRVVTGKRIVCQAIWQGKNVYVKIFLGKGANRYAERDALGVGLLQRAGILTPSLLAISSISLYGARLLIFAEIENTTNVEQQYIQACDSEKHQITLLLVSTLAQHHQHCLVQTDLYLKNFLIKDNQVYTLDGDGIRRLSVFFGKHQKLKNLAILLSKLDVLETAHIPEYYRHYCFCSHAVSRERDERKLRKLVEKNRFLAATAYADKKVFRNCSDVSVVKSFRKFLVIANEFEVEPAMLMDLDTSLANRERNLKNGNTCTVGQYVLAGKHVVIKRYNIKNFWHRISRALRSSRAALSWANAHRLQLLDIPTAKPIALVECRLGWLRGKAYFLSEYIDAPDVIQFFLQSDNAAEQHLVLKNLAKLMHRLYLLRIFHGDMKGTNIKIVNQQPVLIDLDAMQANSGKCLTSFDNRHAKDLLRLIKNWDQHSHVTNGLKQALATEYGAAKHVLIRAGIV